MDRGQELIPTCGLLRMNAQKLFTDRSIFNMSAFKILHTHGDWLFSEDLWELISGQNLYSST